MFAICISGFLVLSLAGSILLWATFVVAKRTDCELVATSDLLVIDIPEEMPQIVGLIPSKAD